LANGTSTDKLFAFRDKRPGMDTPSKLDAEQEGDIFMIEPNIK